MSFNEVMAELPKLTFEQRQLVMRRAMELDEFSLSPEEERLVEERLAEYRRDPSSGVSLQEMERRLRARLGS
ncbi:MAG TPA: hypothetical protein VHD32_03865 [Candidatus Didemnitutus sp.]|nr:hypothetical protein [Candidatus Didemnitutus sp.]